MMAFACRLPPELWSTVMNYRQYRANRSAFPAAELARYCGQWVAFSLDGRRLIAGAEDIERLEEQLATLGEDPQQVALEHLPGPEDDISLGGADFLVVSQRNTAMGDSQAQ